MKTKYLMNKISPLILLCLISIQSFPSSYEWQHSSLKDEGLNNLKIKTLSDEFRNGIHGYVDAFLLIKNGKIVHEEYYKNDYSKLTKNLKLEQNFIENRATLLAAGTCPNTSKLLRLTQDSDTFFKTRKRQVSHYKNKKK